MKKFISMILCVFILSVTLLGLGSCAQDQSDQAEDSKVNTQLEGDMYVPPDVNYGGKEFNVCTWSLADDWVLELSNELSAIDSQTFYHLKNVEHELGIKFNIAAEYPGGYNEIGNFINKIYMLSGDDGIDLVCQYSLAASVGAQQGLYTNLLDLDYIKWDADYWSEDLVKENSINGKMYYCTGDLTGSVVKNMFLMAYNYNLANDYKMGDLYQMVREGTWTIEKLETLSARVYSDNNNNEARDVGDTFGLVIGAYNCIEAFQYGSNLRCLVINSLGELEINEDLYTERGVDISEKVKKLLHSNSGAYCNTKDNERYDDAISKGTAVFMPLDANYVISTLSKSGVDYGFLPLPKYDEQQEGYFTTLSMMYSMFSIPIVARDANMSAAVMESMSHDGYANLNPVIFNALQYRYSNRSDDSEMLETLRRGIIYDSGRVLEFVNVFSLFRRAVRDNDQITTYYAAGREQFESAIGEANFMFS